MTQPPTMRTDLRGPSATPLPGPALPASPMPPAGDVDWAGEPPTLSVPHPATPIPSAAPAFAPVPGMVPPGLPSPVSPHAGPFPASGPLIVPPALGGAQPWCPVPMLDGERVLRFHRTPFWSYPPAVFGLFAGLTVLGLFGIAGGAGGAFVGLLVLVGAVAFVRRRSWKQSGVWFTSERIVLREGDRTVLVPYGEVVRSSLVLEGDAVGFRTVGGNDVVLKGIPDTPAVLNLLYTQAGGAGPRLPAP